MKLKLTTKDNLLVLIACIAAVLSLSSARRGKEFWNNDDDGFAFASYYQDNMVLQMKPHRAVIWGYGTVGSVVKLSFGKEMYSAKVVPGFNKTGVWKVLLQAQPAGGPHRIQAIEEGNVGLHSQIALENVLFGDVWVCSGQSNMEFTMSMVFNASEELALSSEYSDIRVMTPAKVTSEIPLNDFHTIEQGWSLPSKKTLGGPEHTYFSAVCWFYGRHLYDSLKIPIGLVSPAWGGTPVEAWSSVRALEQCGLNEISNMKTDFDNFSSPLIKGPHENSYLWNAMIHPILNMTIKGVIWYQGEANAEYQTSHYACSFPAMIRDWRKSWFEGTGQQTHAQFPFGFVQLAPDVSSKALHFPLIRWHQTADYGYVPNPKMPNTFMAVAMDLGDPTSPYGSIHPRDKQDVASRLFRGALNVVYGQDVQYQGPFPESAMKLKNGHVVITYSSDQRLQVNKEGGFQVCCSCSDCVVEDGRFSLHWHRAPITSSTNQTVTLNTFYCDITGGAPTHLRYGWKAWPCFFKRCSVYNNVGLPGQPFFLSIN